MVVLSSLSSSLYMVMQTAIFGNLFLSMDSFFILPSIHVVLIYLFVPFFLKPAGLMLGFNLVLVKAMVSNDTNLAGFHRAAFDKGISSGSVSRRSSSSSKSWVSSIYLFIFFY